ncbi:hypothetical protein R1flu_016577 [Riccia fluitans]|uniref:Uncharacterized protein n=1 Tax=Riccia fluitans TaxID=41844 RepID=A0ABD1YM92_9MARC
MAMAISCTSRTSAALAHLGLRLHLLPLMSRTRNSLNSRKFGEFGVRGDAILRSSALAEGFRIRIRAVVAGEGEEVEESDRPKTMSSKTRPKTISSRIGSASRPGSQRPAAGSKEKGRSSNIISALLDDMAGFMAPREKGDIRDVVLMSFSFALFIYISQHLVHAYCVLKHTLQPFHHF